MQIEWNEVTVHACLLNGQQDPHDLSETLNHQDSNGLRPPELQSQSHLFVNMF